MAAPNCMAIYQRVVRMFHNMKSENVSLEKIFIKNLDIHTGNHKTHVTQNLCITERLYSASLYYFHCQHVKRRNAVQTSLPKMLRGCT